MKAEDVSRITKLLFELVDSVHFRGSDVEKAAELRAGLATLNKIALEAAGQERVNGEAKENNGG